MTRVNVLDRVRLEIERDLAAGELVNLLQNPSGELGAWAWVTPVAGSNMQAFDNSNLAYTSPGGVASYFYSEAFSVTPTKYVAASWIADNVTGYYKVRFEWLDSAGAVASSSTQTGYLTTSASAASYAPVVVPGGAVKARLRFDHYSNTSGGNPAASSQLFFHAATVATADTATELGGVPHINLCTNPSFETNTTGWAVSGGTITRVTTPTPQDGTGAAQVSKTVSSGPTPYFGGMAVVPGQAYTASAYVRQGSVTPTATVWIAFYNGGGGLLQATSGSTVTTNSTWQRASHTNAIAPTGAVTAEVSVVFATGASSGTMLLDAVLFEQSSTLNAYYAGTTYSGSVLPTLPPAYYVSVTAESASLSVERKELNLSTLTGTVVSTSLDPALSTLLAPRRRCRVLVNIAAAGDPEDWQAIFTGKTQKANVEYRLLAHDETKRAVITMTAVDAVTQLSQVPRPDGVGTIAELPYVLEACGVPWSVNGSGNQVSSATVVASNDQAYAIDQVAVTRDSVGGYAWVDRKGVLQVFDAAEMMTVPVTTLDETDYNTDFGISYATDRVINSVTVSAYEVNPATGETGVATYGPYLATSLQTGDDVYDKTFTVQGLTEAEIETLADAILAANATPTRIVDYVVLPLTEETIGSAVLDLYDLVTVTNVRADLADDLRVVGVTHTIEASSSGTKWLLRLDFAGDGSVAQPQVIPEPGVRSGTIQSGLYEATSTNTASITNATMTTIGAWSRSPALSGSGTYFSSYATGVWTFAVAGTFLITYSVSFAANATGRRIAMLMKNGAEVRRSTTGAVSGEVMTVEVTHLLDVTAGDTVETVVYQSSGGGLALNASPVHKLQVIEQH